jgi:hypothetical protein
MELDALLPWLQENATGPLSNPDEFSSQPQTQLLYYSPLYVYVSQMVSSL